MNYRESLQREDRITAQAAFLRIQINEILRNAEQKGGVNTMSERVGVPIDVRGEFRLPSGTVRVENPEDLIRHGIHVSPHAIEATWGTEGVEIYNAGRIQK